MSRPSWTPTGFLGLGLILAPVVAYFHLVVVASTDVPYLDDYDAIVRFLRVFLDEESPSERLRLFFSRHNEHVMATLRGATLLSYALRGWLDLTLLNLLGNGFLALLLWMLFLAFRPGAPPAEKLLGFAPAALLLVQPQFWMVLLSATTSLSGFAAATWAALAFLALRRDSGAAFGAAVLCGVAASVSLGGGILVFPIGALLLVLRQRPRRALAWCAIALPLFGAWLAVDFREGTTGRPLPPMDRSLLYGLNFVGSAGTFSRRGLSLVVGALLLTSAGALAIRGLPRRNPVLFSILLFVLGNIAANTLLRASQGPEVPLFQPRYRFYSALLLPLTYLGWAELIRAPRAARAWLGASLAIALSFSLLSFRLYRDEVLDVSRGLDQGFEYWWKTGEHGLIHPDFRKASGILLEAISRGHLRLPDAFVERQGARPVAVALPPPGDAIAIHLDAPHQDERALLLSGWAQVAEDAERQDLAVVLRSKDRTLVFQARPVLRAGLEGSSRPRRLLHSGFRALVPKRAVEPGRYRVGILVRREGRLYLTYLEEPIDVG